MDGVKRVAMVETLTTDGGFAIDTGDQIDLFRYQLDNHLGSACLELDGAALVITYEEYSPYGSTSYRASKSAVEVSARRYRYTGKERDEETGLYYYGARYYAAWLGRWTSADPLGLQAGVNLYLYCRAGPLVYADPDGMLGDNVVTPQDRRVDRLQSGKITQQQYREELGAEAAGAAIGVSVWASVTVGPAAASAVVESEAAAGFGEAVFSTARTGAAYVRLAGASVAVWGPKVAGFIQELGAPGSTGGVNPGEVVESGLAKLEGTAGGSSGKGFLSGIVDDAAKAGGSVLDRLGAKLFPNAGTLAAVPAKAAASPAGHAVEETVASGGSHLDEAGSGLSGLGKGLWQTLSKAEDAEASAAKGATLKPYARPGGGHHVPAKSAFAGAPGYDPNAALAIPNAELRRLGVSHGAVTGAQMTGYRALKKSGAPLTWEAVTTIETNALIRGGMKREMAEATVAKAVDALKQAGVAGPTRIPWGK